jgi:hypothetical protein
MLSRPVLKKIDSQTAHLALHPISKKYYTTAKIYFMCLFSEIGGDGVTGTHEYIYIIRRGSILDVEEKDWFRFHLYAPFHELSSNFIYES